MKISLLLVPALAGATAGLAAQNAPVTIPKEVQHVEGNSLHIMPFAHSNMRFQHLIHAKHLPFKSGQLLWGINFRHDNWYTTNYQAKTLRWVVIMTETNQSTLAGATNPWSTTFTSNYGSTPKVVVGTGAYNATTKSWSALKPVTVSVPARVGPDKTKAIGGPVVKIPFGPGTKFFKYNGGNLVIEIIAFAALDANGIGTAGVDSNLSYNGDRTFPGQNAGGTNAFTGIGGISGGPCPSGKNTIDFGPFPAASNMKPGGSMRTRLLSAQAAGTPVPGVGVLLLGTGAPISVDLGLFGFTTGCRLFANLSVPLQYPVAAVGAGGLIDNTVPIPNLPAAIGFNVQAQWLVIDLAKTGIASLSFSGLGSRVITATGASGFDSGYGYFYGGTTAAPADPSKQLTMTIGRWNNRADVIMLYTRP